MKTRAFRALAALSLALASGCVYANTRTPLDTDLDRTTLGAKEGESQYQSVLWLFAWGDAGTKAAAKNGGIQTILHADQETLMVLLGLYFRHKTVVYGD